MSRVIDALLRIGVFAAVGLTLAACSDRRPPPQAAARVPAPPAQLAPPAQAPQLTVNRVSGLVGVEAVNAPARDVFSALAQKAGVEVAGLEHVSGTITMRAEPEDLGVLLGRLTVGRNVIVARSKEGFRVTFLPERAVTDAARAHSEPQAPSAPVAPPYGAAAAPTARPTGAYVVEEVYDTTGRGPGVVIRQAAPAAPLVSRPVALPPSQGGTAPAPDRQPDGGAPIIVEEIFDPRAPGGVRIVTQQPGAAPGR